MSTKIEIEERHQHHLLSKCIVSYCDKMICVTCSWRGIYTVCSFACQDYMTEKKGTYIAQVHDIYYK